MSRQKSSKGLHVPNKSQTEPKRKQNPKNYKEVPVSEMSLDFKNFIIDDSSWQSTVVILKLENTKMYNDFLRCFNVLPDDTTLITKDMIDIRSPTKTDKINSKVFKSDKINTKNDNQSKKAIKPNETQPKPLSSNSNTANCSKICERLKNYIYQLRKSDLDSVEGRKDIIGGGSCETGDKATKWNTKLPINRNIILFGFDNKEMIDEMLKFCLPIKSIVNVKPFGTYEKNYTRLSANKTLKPSSFKSKKGSINSTKGLLNETNYVTSTNDDFINDIQKGLRDDSFLVYKDIVIINYLTDFIDKSQELSSKNNQNLINIIRHIKDSWDKYNSYKKALKIVDIPLVRQNSSLTNAGLYNALISMIPLECVSIPIVVHCILEQVIWDESLSLKSDNSFVTSNNHSFFPGSTLSMINDRKSSSYNKDNFEKITKEIVEVDSPENLEKMDQFSNIPKELINLTPYLISSGNTAKCDTFHLNLTEFNFEQITTNMLSLSPIYKLWQYYPHQHPDVSKWFQFHIEKLKECTNTCFLTNNNKLFRIFVHESIMNLFVLMIRKIHDNKNYEEISLKNSEYAISNHKQSITDVNASIFVKEIISCIVSTVPYLSLTKNTDDVFANSPKSSLLSFSHSSKKDCLPWWSNSMISDSETLSSPLKLKKLHEENKLATLKSFLNCSEFVHLFEQNLTLERDDMLMDSLKHFEFIEEFTSNEMCQSLQNAFQSFSTIHYDYFEPTDTILVWFNNNTDDECLTNYYNDCGVLETPLCFRDFHTYKLKAKREFVYISMNKAAATNHNDSIKTSIDNREYDSFNTVRIMDNFDKEEPLISTLTAYNLLPFRVEFNDYIQSFISPDSSSVRVRRSNFVNEECNYSIEISKNNMNLQYNIHSNNTKKNFYLFVNINEYFRASLCLSWESSHKLLRNNKSIDSTHSLNFYCDPIITLSSGLTLEIISTNSSVGPFYIRQKYLAKGISSSNIWDEDYRCYLSNGVMLIFYSNDTVEIFYANGTRVKCNSFDLIEYDLLDNTETVSEELNIDTKTSKTKKKATKQDDSKDGANDLKTAMLPDKATNKPSSVTDTLNPLLFKVTQHSVLTWNGDYCQFENGQTTKPTTGGDLRMAFDKYNQELYWRRSDGTCSLFTPEKLTVSFPDNSLITTTVDDSKEVNAIDTTILNKQGEDSLHDSNTTDHFPSLFIQESNTTLLFDRNSPTNLPFFDDDQSYVFLESNYIFEHKNYATVSFIEGGNVAIIYFPNNIQIKVGKHGLTQINGFDSERISLTQRGLVFEASVLDNNYEKSCTTLNFEHVFTKPQIVSQTVDSFGNVFSIDERGNTNLLKVKKGSRNYKDLSQVSVKYPKKKERYFVFNRDLSGYEIINEKYEEKSFSCHTKDFKLPLTNNTQETGIFSVFRYNFIYKTTSDSYLLEEKHRILPKLIKRKDLLRTNEMPKTVWFFHQLSKCDKDDDKHEPKTYAKDCLKAIFIKNYMKIKTNNVNFTLLFSNCLKSYIGKNELIFHKYSNMFSQDERNSDVYAEGEEHKQVALGSKSYHVVDNIPLVLSQD